MKVRDVIKHIGENGWVLVVTRGADFERHVGRENICPNVQAALARPGQLFDRRKRARPQDSEE